MFIELQEIIRSNANEIRNFMINCDEILFIDICIFTDDNNRYWRLKLKNCQDYFLITNESYDKLKTILTNQNVNYN